MNWRRGLFRLWVVTSVLWLLTSGAFLVALAGSEKEYREKPGSVVEYHSAEAPWEKYALAELETVRVWKMPPWPLIGLALAVPPVLLVVGFSALWAGRWTVRGFKGPE